MKWMLLILVVNADDITHPVHEDYQIYSSEAACDAASRAIDSAIQSPDPKLRSISVCIPQSAFDPKPLDHGSEEPDDDGRPSV